jgi:hypothetical protein
MQKFARSLFMFHFFASSDEKAQGGAAGDEKEPIKRAPADTTNARPAGDRPSRPAGDRPQRRPPTPSS